MPASILLPACLILFGVSAQCPAADADGLVVKSVKVRTTKDGVNPWDIGGGAPDLRIEIERTSKPGKGERYESEVKKDTFEATFNARTFSVRAEDEIEITIWDDDLGDDDVCGRLKLTITKDQLKEKEIKLSFENVLELKLAID